MNSYIIIIIYIFLLLKQYWIEYLSKFSLIFQLIYIPRKMNKGLNLDIQMIKEIKCAKSFKISSERKNYNSFNFNSLIKILSV